jgi:hypothetical protein
MLKYIQPVVKKLVSATGAINYNVLQNNGRIAHQEVEHVSVWHGGWSMELPLTYMIGSFPYGLIASLHLSHRKLMKF